MGRGTATGNSRLRCFTASSLLLKAFQYLWTCYHVFMDKGIVFAKENLTGT